MNTSRIVVADCYPIVRSGLRGLFAQYEQFEIVGEAATCKEIIHFTCKTRPDILIVDPFIPGTSPVDLLTEIGSQGLVTNVVVYAGLPEKSLVRPVLDSGVKGYVLKEEPLEVVLKAVKIIAEGGLWYSQRIYESMLRPQLSSMGESCASDLSPVDLQVLILISSGFKNDQIAAHMNVSSRSVRYYVERLLDKTGTKNRTEAVVKAIHRGWIRHPSNWLNDQS